MSYRKCKVEVMIKVKYTPTSKTTKKIMNNTTTIQQLQQNLQPNKNNLPDKILLVDKTDKK